MNDLTRPAVFPHTYIASCPSDPSDVAPGLYLLVSRMVRNENGDFLAPYLRRALFRIEGASLAEILRYKHIVHRHVQYTVMPKLIAENWPQEQIVGITQSYPVEIFVDDTGAYYAVDDKNVYIDPRGYSLPPEVATTGPISLLNQAMIDVETDYRAVTYDDMASSLPLVVERENATVYIFGDRIKVHTHGRTGKSMQFTLGSYSWSLQTNGIYIHAVDALKRSHFYQVDEISGFVPTFVDTAGSGARVQACIEEVLNEVDTFSDMPFVELVTYNGMVEREEGTGELHFVNHYGKLTIVKF